MVNFMPEDTDLKKNFFQNIKEGFWWLCVILLESSKNFASFIINTIKMSTWEASTSWSISGRKYFNTLKFLTTHSRKAHSANSNDVLYFTTFYRFESNFSFVISYTPCKSHLVSTSEFTYYNYCFHFCLWAPCPWIYFTGDFFDRGKNYFLKLFFDN